MRYWRHPDSAQTFDPVAHEWLVEPAPDSYFYVLKDTDRPSPMQEGTLAGFVLVPASDVPIHVRSLARARWASHCRWRSPDR